MCVCKNRNQGGKIPPSEGLEGFDSEPSAGFAWERHRVGLKGCVFGGLRGTSEHPSSHSWPWKEKKGVIGGYCYPSSCNMAKPHSSLVVVHLQLNPGRGRCVLLGSSAPQHICWGPVIPFSILVYPGADGVSDFGAVPTFACFPALLETSSPSPWSPSFPSSSQNRTGPFLSAWRGKRGCGESSIKCVCGFSLLPYPASPLCRPGCCGGERLSAAFLLELAPQGPGWSLGDGTAGREPIFRSPSRGSRGKSPTCSYSLVAVCHALVCLCFLGANWELLVYLSIGSWLCTSA